MEFYNVPVIERPEVRTAFDIGYRLFYWVLDNNPDYSKQNLIYHFNGKREWYMQHCILATISAFEIGSFVKDLGGNPDFERIAKFSPFHDIAVVTRNNLDFHEDWSMTVCREVYQQAQSFLEENNFDGSRFLTNYDDSTFINTIFRSTDIMPGRSDTVYELSNDALCVGPADLCWFFKAPFGLSPDDNFRWFIAWNAAALAEFALLTFGRENQKKLAQASPGDWVIGQTKFFNMMIERYIRGFTQQFLGIENEQKVKLFFSQFSSTYMNNQEQWETEIAYYKSLLEKDSSGKLINIEICRQVTDIMCRNNIETHLPLKRSSCIR